MRLIIVSKKSNGAGDVMSDALEKYRLIIEFPKTEVTESFSKKRLAEKLKYFLMSVLAISRNCMEITLEVVE